MELSQGIKNRIASYAQSVYDRWERDHEGNSEVYGTGGICNDIAEDIASILEEELGFDAFPQYNQYRCHTAVIVADHEDKVLWEVDIPPYEYESGFEYNWKKRKGVVFTPDMVRVDIGGDYEEFFDGDGEYIHEGLKKWFKEKWVDISRKKKDGSHPECGASSDNKSRKKDHRKAYPKCVPKAKAKEMTKKEKESASRRKRKAEKNTSKSSKRPTYVKTKKNEMAEDNELMGALMDSYGSGIPTVSGTAVFFDQTPEYRKHIPKIGDFYKNASNLWYQNKGVGIKPEDMPKCIKDNVDYIAEKQAMRANPLGEGDCGSNEAVELAEGDDIALKEGYYPIELAEDAIRRRIMGTDYEPKMLDEAQYNGKNVKLNKPKRGGSKKFYVYVNSGEKTKDGKIKAKKVSFGSDSMEIRRDDPEARKNFRARHNCSDKKDKKTAGYWSCKMWQAGKSVGDMLETAYKDMAELLIKSVEDSIKKML